MEGGASVRWAAPELFTPNPVSLKHASTSHYTDVWSFGMLCLELMTGDRPFHHLTREILVAMDLQEGKLPERPGDPATSRGLSEGLWAIMMRCWDHIPESRPSMIRVMEMLRPLLHTASPPGTQLDLP